MAEKKAKRAYVPDEDLDPEVAAAIRPDYEPPPRPEPTIGAWGPYPSYPERHYGRSEDIPAERVPGEDLVAAMGRPGFGRGPVRPLQAQGGYESAPPQPIRGPLPPSDREALRQLAHPYMFAAKVPVTATEPTLDEVAARYKAGKATYAELKAAQGREDAKLAQAPAPPAEKKDTYVPEIPPDESWMVPYLPGQPAPWGGTAEKPTAVVGKLDPKTGRIVFRSPQEQALAQQLADEEDAAIAKEEEAKIPKVDESQTTGVQASSVADGQPQATLAQTVSVPASNAPRIAPEYIDTIAGGEAKQYLGVGEESTVEAQAAEEMARAKEQNLEAIRTQELLDQQEQAKQRKQLDEHMAELQAKSDALKNRKIDPNREWDKLPLGNKILMGIGQFLSGFGANLMGHPEAGRNFIGELMQRSIQLQQEEFNMEEKGLETDRSLFADKYRIFGDDNKARAAAVQDMIAMANMEIDQLAEKYKSPGIMARAEQLKGQLMQQFGKEMGALHVYTPAHMATVGGTGPGGGVILDVTSDEVVELPGPDHTVVTIPKADRERVISDLRIAQDVNAALPRIRELAKADAFTRITPSWHAQWEAATKVFTLPELQGVGSKGGWGIFTAFTSPVAPRWRVLVEGGVKAAQAIADESRKRAMVAVNQSAQFVVNPVVVPDLKASKEIGRPVTQIRYELVRPWDKDAPNPRVLGATTVAGVPAPGGGRGGVRAPGGGGAGGVQAPGAQRGGKEFIPPK